MNREIKFRIWNKKSQSWVHGPGQEVNLFGEMILLGGFMDKIPLVEILQDCVVCQYTSLKDKEGSDIYDGDILARDYSTKYYIGRDIRGGKDCGAKYSDMPAPFRSVYGVSWFNGTYEVNCSEYSILINGWVANLLHDNRHLKEGLKPYGFGAAHPLGLEFESENYGAFGVVAAKVSIIGNIYDNPDLLKQT